MNWLAIVPVVLMLATGNLWIRVQSGVAVFVDGQPVGESTADEGGKLVKGLAAGTHQVLLKSSSGGESRVSVEITDNDTQEITISPLSLTKRPSAATSTSGSIALPIPSAGCIVSLDEKPQANGNGEVRVEGIAPGKHALSVRCGNKTAEGSVEVVAGSIANVSADFGTHRLSTTQEARKPIALNVVSTNERIIRNAEMPEEWKQALIAVSVPGCAIQRLTPLMQVPGVGVWYRCGGTSPYRLLEAIQAQPMVAKAGIVDTRYLKTSEMDIYIVMQLRYRQ